MAEVLLEDFDDLAAGWTAGTLRTGRTGLGLTVTGTTPSKWTIPAVSESDTVTIGFAFRLTVLTSQRPILNLQSDAGATSHTQVMVNADGSISVLRGATAGVVVAGPSAAGLVAINTWNYFELQVRLHDTAGTVTARLNGSTILSATGLDTKNVGTKTTYDTVSLQASSGSATTFDELYVRTGAGETFRGDTVLGSCTDVLREPFDSLAAWDTSGGGALTTGRTGNGLGVSGGAQAIYTIPSGSRSYGLTLGFAFRLNATLAANLNFLQLWDDAATPAVQTSLKTNSDGSINVNRGGPAGTSIATTSPGLIVTGTWVYIEIQILFHDTGGSIAIRANGASVFTTTVDADTKASGVAPNYSQLRLIGPSAGVNTATWDDLYILTGTTCTFQGDPSTGPVAGSGSTSITFSASATGVATVFASGAATITFAASATGGVTVTASGTTSITFDASATGFIPVGVSAAATITFDASASGVVIVSVSASTTITFDAVNVGSVIVPPGSALARAGITFYPVVTSTDLIVIGRATVVPSTATISPVSYVSPPWTPEPGALVGALMAVPVYEHDDPVADTILATDTFGGTSDWNPAVDHMGDSALAGLPARWRYMVWYATVGPNPVPGLVTIAPVGSVPAYLDGSLLGASEPYVDHHVLFFEVRGQSKVRPVGRVGIGQSGTMDVIPGEGPIFEYPEDDVDVLMGDPPADVYLTDALPVAPSSIELGFVVQGLDAVGRYFDPSTGDEPIFVGDPPPFTMTAPAGWATIGADPPEPGPYVSSRVLWAYRNGMGAPTDTWLGETAVVPVLDPDDPFGPGGAPNVIEQHQRQPLVAMSVEFRAAVADPAPPVVTEFGVWIQTADGTWVDRTCDIRSIEVERGRSTYTDGFSAATATLVFANPEGVYSAWNPASIWAAYGGHYQAGVPVQVWGYTAGEATPMFTGTTDSVVDTFPGTVDSQSVVQATDGFKSFARHTTVALQGNAFVGTGEYAGQRVHRLATAAGWAGPRAIDTGWTRMNATTMEGNTMDALRETGESEWGWLFVDEAGTLVFRQRDALQTDPRMTTVQWVFTDTDDIAGVCYQEPFELVVDEEGILNVATIQNAAPPDGSLVGELSTWSAVDAPSRAHYGPRTWTKTLPIFDGALGVAQVVVMEYGDDDKHLAALTFNALRPGNRDCAVNIRVNDRIKVYRHYPGGFVLKQALLVQGIHHTITPGGDRDQDPAQWDVTIQTATAALIFGFGHWDDPAVDEDGDEHGWDVDQFGI